MTSLSALPSLALGGILYYGAFSRLTHGAHTPDFYAYQVARLPDDGSTAATALPILDLVLGSLLVLGRRRVRRWAAAAFVGLQGVGVYMLFKDGKDVTPDLGLVALGGLAVLGAA